MVSAKKAAKKAKTQKPLEETPAETTYTVESFEEIQEEQAAPDLPKVEEYSSPAAVVPRQEPKPAPAKVAHVAQNYDEVVTRIALKTTVKFIGRWYTLRKGKPLIAPRVVMENLERAGFVEKK